MAKALLVAIVLAAIAVVAGVVVSNRNAESEAHERQARDRAFLQAMVPHHESAISMAEVAKARAETPEMKKLADDIITAQAREITQIRAIHQRLFGSELQADSGVHSVLGLSASEAGMDHGAESTFDELRAANPFDRAFIDMMTPHHEGAIRMAKAVLETTQDEEIRRLANDIVSAQEKEIDLMADVRIRDYGTAPPASSSAAPAHEVH